MKKIKLTCLAALLALNTSVFAADANFTCPQPYEIQSTDFTAPSIWTAPAMAHSKDPGVGLGGKVVKEFLGVEPATVNHQKGWVCVYKTEGGVSVTDYENKIKTIVRDTHYLRKYRDKVNKAFEDAQPYLKNYPKDIPLGFVGYVKKTK